MLAPEMMTLGKKTVTMSELMKVFNQYLEFVVCFGFGNIWICELTLSVVNWFIVT